MRRRASAEASRYGAGRRVSTAYASTAAGAAMNIGSAARSRRVISPVAGAWCWCQAQTAAIMQLVSGRNPGTPPSEPFSPFPTQGPARPLDRLGREDPDVPLRNRYEQPTLAHQLDRQRGRLDLDATTPEPHLEDHSRFQARFSPNLLGDHQSPGSIDGSFHGTDPTMFHDPVAVRPVPALPSSRRAPTAGRAAWRAGTESHAAPQGFGWTTTPRRARGRPAAGGFT